MNDLGKRIKELRKKKDLTQEKLADMLGITYKAVSKWECGMTSPDISMIVPLARILCVTTDELLGLVPIEKDERKAYFDAEYHQFWNKEHEEDLEISRQAVAEYPTDYRYLHWLASNEWYVGYSVEYYGTDRGKELLESSAKHNLMILENCGDPVMKKEAIAGLVYAYSSMDKLDEAKRYAESYPDDKETDRDELLLCCLKGNELNALRKKIVRKKMMQLCFSLDSLWRYGYPDCPEAMDAEEKMIKAVITDNNYQIFNGNLSDVYLERAKRAIKNNDPDEAIRCLGICYAHAKEYDRMDKTGIEEYTCPVLKGSVTDHRERRGLDFTRAEYARDSIMEEKLFEKLRDRVDFKEIFKL